MGYTKQNVIHSAMHGRCITLPSMAAHLPYLPGSPPVSRWVLTSFVPPAHNQGVSLAPATGNMQRKACSECGRIALRCEIEMAPIFGIHALTAESRTALKIGTDDDLNDGRKQCADRRNGCSRM